MIYMNKLKRWCRTKAGKRILAVFGAMLVMCSMAVPAFAVEGEAAGADAIAAAKSIIGEATATINVANLTTILVYGVGIAIVLFLMWWGARKLLRIVTAAFKRGKVSV
jgi:hypothetical protein